MIYFVKANDRIKIGYADNPSSRISSLQTSNPYTLEVLLIIDGDYTLEHKLHLKFSDDRVSGEWFHFSKAIKEYIYNNLSDDRRYEFGFINEDFTGNEQILRLRKENKLTLQSFGELLGMTTQSAAEIQQREKLGSITIKGMRKVAEVLGYEFEYRFVKKSEESQSKT